MIKFLFFIQCTSRHNFGLQAVPAPKLQRFSPILRFLSVCDPAGRDHTAWNGYSVTQTTHRGRIQPSGDFWWFDASFPQNTFYSPENGNLGI